MKSFNERCSQLLFEKKLISEDQITQISSYRALNIFSLNGELKLFLYLSILIFTSGIGILIYENINTLGHSILIGLLLICSILCYYLSFKKSNGFQKQETNFENPLHNYLVLTSYLLSCIFIAYLQFQYTAFGKHYGLATLAPTLLGLFTAYYFDNKNVLSIALTGLTAYIGLTVSPQTLLQNNFYETDSLSYSAIGLGFVFIIWVIYSSRINLKKHFALVYLSFALHLISISCLNNLYKPYWILFVCILAASSFYFYKASYQLKSVSLFVFTVIYAFCGLNIIAFKTIESIPFIDFFIVLLVYSTPFYFGGTIYLFIQLIKKFNKEIKDDRTQ